MSPLNICKHKSVIPELVLTFPLPGNLWDQEWQVPLALIVFSYLLYSSCFGICGLADSRLTAPPRAG